MAETSTLKSVRNLLNNVRKFNDMPGPKQAAFRAQLTRVEKLVTEETEPELAGYLAKVREIIGEAETKTYRKQTPDEVVAEYSEKYLGYSGRQRAAFKAKVTRMINTASEDSDMETVKILETLQNQITEDDQQASWNLIHKLGEGLDDLLSTDSD